MDTNNRQHPPYCYQPEESWQAVCSMVALRRTLYPRTLGQSAFYRATDDYSEYDVERWSCVRAGAVGV